MEELERKIEEAPKLAQEEQERRRQERILRASTRRSPLDSPDILQDSRHAEDLFSERRPRRPRRAERRQARVRLIVSCLAVLALVAVVIFLTIQMFNHL